MSGASAQWGRRQAGLLGASGVLLLIFLVISPEFRSPTKLLDQTSTWVEVGILAPFALFVILTGGIDLSVASIMALVGVTIGRLHFEEGVPIGPAAAIGLALGALAGAVNGAIIVLARIPDLVVTLATMAIYRGLAQAVARNQDYSGLPEGYRFLDDGLVVGIPVPWLVLLTVWIVAYLLLHHSPVGRRVYSLGSNPRAARLAGVSVARVRILVYGLSGLAAAVAAILYTVRSNAARSDDAEGFELYAITCVVLGGASIAGGRGSAAGVFLGFVFLGLLRSGLDLTGVHEFWQKLAMGTLLVGIAAINERLAGTKSA